MKTRIIQKPPCPFTFIGALKALGSGANGYSFIGARPTNVLTLTGCKV